MISKENVKHIAELARLGLSEKEINEMQKELSSILDYFEKIKKIDVSKIEPTSHSVKVENVMRKDEKVSGKSEHKKELVDLAPDSEKGYIKVKSVL